MTLDFEPLEEYFQRINKWKGFTEDEKAKIYKDLIDGHFRSAKEYVETIENMLKERNQ